MNRRSSAPAPLGAGMVLCALFLLMTDALMLPSALQTYTVGRAVARALAQQARGLQ